MIEIKKIDQYDKMIVNSVVSIHMSTFQGFFLTFMGKGFLKHLYKSFIKNKDSGLLIAKENESILGFLAYSKNMSELYKFMIKKELFFFAYYSFIAFLKRPKIFLRLIRAFLKPKETKRVEKFIELSSIGVDPDSKNRGVGTLLINHLKAIIDFNEFSYINLETDALNNDKVNSFYKKNGFKLSRQYTTPEGRLMNEFHFEG